ncbi:type VI secretion system protein TssL, long form [uncultured Pseudacidovorax sp.]|uniref:type VI secretion system protein TssL, long form n=1 Tax=uncultured Pseudacidovorax sp. TaxID=679313 RepID=UPI0025F55252|nr:type VI secretion system protein TssL, long form [uncultured Pseudacidovorax sp.]
MKKPEIVGPTETVQPRAVKLSPESPLEARLAAIKAARNPLLEAAQPLLRVLAGMPSDLPPEGVVAFRGLLEHEVRRFQVLCNEVQIRHERVVAASYVLCTAIDEAANSTVWGGAPEGRVPEQSGPAGLWAAKSLASTFHEDSRGGDKVFLLIGRLAASPQEHIDLLELLHQVLGLGFEGRYSNATNGRRQLETIRHRLLTLLAAERGDVPHELSPHWRGERPGKFRLLRSVPVWVSVSLVVLGVAGLFAWYKYQLLQTSEDVEARIVDIGRLRAAASPEAVPAKPAPGRPLRLKELLAPEIARGTVSVEEDGRHSTVTFKGDDMFVPGQAQVNARVLAVLGKVAAEINQVTGTVQVVGHSDNQPIRTSEFPSNQILSEKRAAAVAAVLQARGVQPARLQIRGRGDTAPVADNATAAGRARNRRVDIVVTQGEVSAEPASGNAASGDARPSQAGASSPPQTADSGSTRR